MSEPIIKVHSLSKRYRIGAREEGYKTFRETIVDGIMAPVRNLKRLNRLTKFNDSTRQPSEDIIWALKDVTFTVKEGEVLGIIGKNGAGKTTLLKILSRITEPTKGFAEIHGRVSSLLEVGTGFHPELTGRENIFLNGAILGMRKSEIKEKFDEIVSFAEIEKFIDTPVKRYSSGMYVRLAFAIAAHLEPEILLVDEVLAVGDAEFQKKCLGKMDDVAKEGRTVLYVSHNMHSIMQLCEKTILLENGWVKMIDKTQNVVNEYLSSNKNLGAEKIWDANNAPQTKEVRLKSVRVVNSNGRVSSTFMISEPIYIEVQFWVLGDIKGIILPNFLVYRGGGLLFSTFKVDLVDKDIYNKRGLLRAICTIPANLLNDGEHYLTTIIIVDYRPIIKAEEIVHFTIQDDSSARGGFTGGWGGEVRPLLHWEIECLQRE